MRTCGSSQSGGSGQACTETHFKKAKLEAQVPYEFTKFPLHPLTCGEALKLLLTHLCALNNSLHAHKVIALQSQL